MLQQQSPEDRGLLGPLCHGGRKLEGKTFYLDDVKNNLAALLSEAVSVLGGKVESFLHKDVSFVVTGSHEGQKCVAPKAEAKAKSIKVHCPIKQEHALSCSDKQRAVMPGSVACVSRGKALLEKAIRNNDRLQKNSVLTNAQLWGVKILYADDVFVYLKQLVRETFNTKQKKAERTSAKQQSSRVVKATALRPPYLKVEDLSRKYKPLHMQSTTFPSVCYSGRFSPFESPPQLEREGKQEGCKHRGRNKVECSIQDKSQSLLSCNPSPWRRRKKDPSYCECCHQSFTNLEEHLQSDQHRTFVLDSTNYSVLDQLVAEMLPGFNPSPLQQPEESVNTSTSLSSRDTGLCELELFSGVETEHAVQALHIQAFNAKVSSSDKGGVYFGTVSPSPGSPFPIPEPDNPITDCQEPHSPPEDLNPGLLLLDAGPLVHCSGEQYSEGAHLSPCDDVCPSIPDPCSLPPVLSPQVYPSHIMELHSSWSELPVLSPQQYTAEEALEVHASEMHTADIVSQALQAVTSPIAFPTLLVDLMKTKSAYELNREGPLGASGVISSKSGSVCPKLVSCRSRSLPRLSVTSQNPKKRCRSASPEYSQNKRRKMSLASNSTYWTALLQKSLTKPRINDIIPKSESCLFFSKLPSQSNICSHTDHESAAEQIHYQKTPQQDLTCSDTYVQKPASCTVEKFGSEQQTLGTFCVSPHVKRPVADVPFWPLPPTLQISDPHKDKFNDGFLSPDIQPLVLHPISSVCIESALIPNLANLSPSSSESDWDCALLSRLGPTSVGPLSVAEQSCELDKEILHRPCTWMHDTSYESHLHTVLQPSPPASSLCDEETDTSAFSRTVVQIVQVQH
ncbi:uncharacterized protein dbf4b [Thalassophryne amazonica]|uniref:uncharacterized protein dbf4b n=1 Tax=Thalassophryne amazonica TaxID=390379 RepID=UPI0014710177|nr:uncharacterized protein dbf4b [Thalassophryne amazonica]